METKSTPKAVRDMKVAEVQGSPKPQQVQIHAGNTTVLTVQLLGQISKALDRIADALEKK
jgi:hypothetical protein